MLGLGLLREEAVATLAAMLVIGIGAGLPWGLMDGLSVSVVPKERAGMAAGIFSTTRVAGEGIALAIVTALLAALVHDSLSTAVPHATPTALSAAATRLATGNLAEAAVLIPDATPFALRAIYQTAFVQLLDGLAVITLLCALAAFASLSRLRVRDASEFAETGW